MRESSSQGLCKRGVAMDRCGPIPLRGLLEQPAELSFGPSALGLQCALPSTFSTCIPEREFPRLEVFGTFLWAGVE